MNDDRIGDDRRADRKVPDLTAANDQADERSIIGQTLDTVHDGYDRARSRVRELLDGAPAAARDAVATGRDYYRRGSAAVARNATDNTALTLLAAGVAVAAVSWLILGRRGGKDEA